eukprot:TRINITY_DN2801_c0_g1_i1.p1 TRINITY_DN2801_c0_g1~~TRINITY_DN2801_c0_g1_i1.p1  ORF type:complete len:2434 (+),score=475.31 TRINITY_DN2801_c0_g1_i1:16-7317(+)
MVDREMYPQHLAVVDVRLKEVRSILFVQCFDKERIQKASPLLQQIPTGVNFANNPLNRVQPITTGWSSIEIGKHCLVLSCTNKLQDKLTIPFGTIVKLEIDRSLNSLLLYRTNFQCSVLVFEDANTLTNIHDGLSESVDSEQENDYWSSDVTSLSPYIYNASKELQRLGYKNESKFWKSVTFNNFEYVVPFKAKQKDIEVVAAFRYRSNFPQLCWGSWEKRTSSFSGSLLFQCARPHILMKAQDIEQGYSDLIEPLPISIKKAAQQDMEYVQLLLSTICSQHTSNAKLTSSSNKSQKQKRVNIFDTGRRLQAVIESNPYAHTTFWNLSDNVSKRLNDVYELALNPQVNFNDVVTKFESTSWMKSVEEYFLMLRQALTVLESGDTLIIQQGSSSPESGGTLATIVSLIQLVVNPHYRTFSGFLTLISKEWSQNGTSPKKLWSHFCLFIHCCQELYEQCPIGFEFNHDFFMFIMDTVYTSEFCRYNYEFDEISKAMHNLSYLVHSNLSSFKNPIYQPSIQILKNISGINGYISVRNLSYWLCYYLRYNPKTIENLEVYENDLLPLTAANTTELILNVKKLFWVPSLGAYGSHLNKWTMMKSSIYSLPSDFGTALSTIQKLVLDGNFLNKVPYQICQMDKLEYLSLSGNQISRVPVYTSLLTNLIELNLDENRIRNVYGIFKLTSLRNLSLHNNSIRSLPFGFKNLTNLESLKVSFNPLHQINGEIIPHLKSLKLLALSKVEASFLPTKINKLKELTILYIQQNNLFQIPTSIGKCTSITLLNASHNHLSSLPKELSQLVHLKRLELAGNQFSELPSWLHKLTNLETVDLSQNQILVINYVVSQMSSLKRIYLRGNKITTLPPSLGALEGTLMVLDVSNNPIEFPSQDILTKGTEAVLKHLNKSMNSTQEVYRMKLLVLGKDNVGKTTLIKSLVKKWDNEGCVTSGVESPLLSGKPLSTDGIDISKYSFLSKKVNNTKGKVKVSVNVWDFAGQDVYYASHQMFLQHSAVYLIVFDLSDINAEQQLEFWFRSIKARVSQPRIILVGTHLDRCGDKFDVSKLESNYKEKFSRYGMLTLIGVSSTNDMNISQLRQYVENEISTHPKVTQKMPLSYIYFESLLHETAKTLPYPIITRKELMRLGTLCNLTTQRDVMRCAYQLHTLGSIIFFDKVVSLQDTIVLNSQWLIKILATLFTTKHRWVKSGIIEFSALDQIWKGYPVDIRPKLLNLLEKFEIIFVLNKKEMKLGDIGSNSNEPMSHRVNGSLPEENSLPNSSSLPSIPIIPAAIQPNPNFMLLPLSKLSNNTPLPNQQSHQVKSLPLKYQPVETLSRNNSSVNLSTSPSSSSTIRPDIPSLGPKLSELNSGDRHLKKTVSLNEFSLDSKNYSEPLSPSSWKLASPNSSSTSIKHTLTSLNIEGLIVRQSPPRSPHTPTESRQTHRGMIKSKSDHHIPEKDPPTKSMSLSPQFERKTDESLSISRESLHIEIKPPEELSKSNDKVESNFSNISGNTNVPPPPPPSPGNTTSPKLQKSKSQKLLNPFSPIKFSPSDSKRKIQKNRSLNQSSNQNPTNFVSPSTMPQLSMIEEWKSNLQVSRKIESKEEAELSREFMESNINKVVLVPSLLPELCPYQSLTQNWSLDGFSKFKQHYQFNRLLTFDFLPAGFFSRVITRLLQHSKNVISLWANGLLATYSQGEAKFFIHRIYSGQDQLDNLVCQILSSDKKVANDLISFIMDVFHEIGLEWTLQVKEYVPVLVGEKDHQLVLVDDLISLIETGNELVTLDKALTLNMNQLVPDYSIGNYNGLHVNKNDMVVGEAIGSGSFATVHKGKLNDETVAIKIMTQHQPDDFKNMFRVLRQEIRLQSQLNHPNITSIKAICLKPHSIAMEFVPCGNVYHHLHEWQKELPFKLRFLIAKEMASALKYLHDHNPPIAHLDFKSPNIMLLKTTSPGDNTKEIFSKLADFGTAEYVYSPFTVRKVDNPVWLAPEILESKPYDEKVDVYGFGVVCWELMTRQKFFGEIKWIAEIQDLIIGAERPPIPDFCPENFRYIITKCWDGNPMNRPSWDWILDTIDSVIPLSSALDEMTKNYHDNLSKNWETKKMEDDDKKALESETLSDDSQKLTEETEESSDMFPKLIELFSPSASPSTNESLINFEKYLDSLSLPQMVSFFQIYKEFYQLQASPLHSRDLSHRILQIIKNLPTDYHKFGIDKDIVQQIVSTCLSSSATVNTVDPIQDKLDTILNDMFRQYLLRIEHSQQSVILQSNPSSTTSSPSNTKRIPLTRSLSKNSSPTVPPPPPSIPTTSSDPLFDDILTDKSLYKQFAQLLPKVFLDSLTLYKEIFEFQNINPSTTQLNEAAKNIASRVQGDLSVNESIAEEIKKVVSQEASLTMFDKVYDELSVPLQAAFQNLVKKNKILSKSKKKRLFRPRKKKSNSRDNDEEDD